MCHLYPYKNVKLLWKFFLLHSSILYSLQKLSQRPDLKTFGYSVDGHNAFAQPLKFDELKNVQASHFSCFNNELKFHILCAEMGEC